MLGQHGGSFLIVILPSWESPKVYIGDSQVS